MELKKRLFVAEREKRKTTKRKKVGGQAKFEKGRWLDPEGRMKTRQGGLERTPNTD